MSFSENISDFIDDDEFADEAIINNKCIEGLFDRAYVDVGDVDSLRPTFYCELAEVETVTQGDSVSVNGSNFVVADKQPEEPFCLLVLHDA